MLYADSNIICDTDQVDASENIKGAHTCRGGTVRSTRSKDMLKSDRSCKPVFENMIVNPDKRKFTFTTLKAGYCGS